MVEQVVEQQEGGVGSVGERESRVRHQSRMRVAVLVLERDGGFVDDPAGRLQREGGVESAVLRVSGQLGLESVDSVPQVFGRESDQVERRLGLGAVGRVE